MKFKTEFIDCEYLTKYDVDMMKYLLCNDSQVAVMTSSVNLNQQFIYYSLVQTAERLIAVKTTVKVNNKHRKKTRTGLDDRSHIHKETEEFDSVSIVRGPNESWEDVKDRASRFVNTIMDVILDLICLSGYRFGYNIPDMLPNHYYHTLK